MKYITESYYRVVVDPTVADGWFLGEPLGISGEPIDAREFTSGSLYNGATPSFVPVEVAGRHLAFNFGAFDVPIVSKDVGTILERFAPGQIQRFPVTVGIHRDAYEVINILNCIPCLSESRSEVLKWNEGDGKPEKVGQYRMITNLTIDPSLTQDKAILRISGCEIALIVVDSLRKALAPLDALGIRFQPVTR